jgi:hypothetical protein
MSDESIHTLKNKTEVSQLASKDAVRQKINDQIKYAVNVSWKREKTKSQRKANQYIPWKCGTTETFGNNTTKPTFHYVKKLGADYIQEMNVTICPESFST